MMRSIPFALALLAAVVVAAPLSAQDGSLKLPPYRKIALKNGLTLLLMEKHGVPIISFNLVVKAGSTFDPGGKEGVASLTAGLLRKGTVLRSADQISTELDFIGGLLGAGADCDSTSGSAEFLMKDLSKGLDILADVGLVMVDVTVLDKKGNPIQNLKKEDFHLFEDGKEQEILTLDEAAENARQVASAAQTDMEDSAPHLGKLVLILFDDSHLSVGQFRLTRDSEERYVKAHMRQQDLFAVASL